jgi:hypothetical protein
MAGKCGILKLNRQNKAVAGGQLKHKNERGIDMDIEFEGFEKIARLNREIIVTEKIDGTNAQILIKPDGEMLVGSRKRFITPENDNFGFAKWAYNNEEELKKLGEGRHFGEWWGSGIQRRYGKTDGDKTFSLFNTSRWADDRPACCDVVPILYKGLFCENAIEDCIADLRHNGSKAAPGFLKSEGVIIWHTALQQFFKVTLEKDELPKALAKGEKAA